MANDLRGETLINFGGEDRVLRFNMDAIRSTERIFGGRSIFGMLKGGETTISADLLIVLLHQGLRSSNPSITEKQVLAWVDDHDEGLDSLAQAIIKAVALCLGGKKARAKLAAVSEASAAERPTIAPETAPTDGTGTAS